MMGLGAREMGREWQKGGQLGGEKIILPQSHRGTNSVISSAALWQKCRFRFYREPMRSISSSENIRSISMMIRSRSA